MSADRALSAAGLAVAKVSGLAGLFVRFAKAAAEMGG
jgi:hypothetical protein